MYIIEAIILGAIQGLTEFIPISSSAHLIIIPWLANWKTHDLLFDVALHLGTLFALLSYFWREWYELVQAHIERSRLKGDRLRSRSSNSRLYYFGQSFSLAFPLRFLACFSNTLSSMPSETSHCS